MECTLEIPGLGKQIVKMTNPKGVTEFLLTPGEGQPYERDISPNPATGFATIQLPAFKGQNVVLKVFDALGNEVADLSNNVLKVENSQCKFDTKILPNGAYFLRFTDGKITFSRTFIIQN
ncbi:MAG: T9SS type A sorting domain-containing protein [Bacteroidota bacterium]